MFWKVQQESNYDGRVYLFLLHAVRFTYEKFRRDGQYSLQTTYTHKNEINYLQGIWYLITHQPRIQQKKRHCIDMASRFSFIYIYLILSVTYVVGLNITIFQKQNISVVFISQLSNIFFLLFGLIPSQIRSTYLTLFINSTAYYLLYFYFSLIAIL